MRAHKIIEAITGGQLQVLDKNLSRDKKPEELLPVFAIQLAASHKFFLGNGDNIPDMEPDPLYCRLPFPICYFEREIPNNSKVPIVSMLALATTEETHERTREAFFPGKPEIHIHWLGQTYTYSTTSKGWILMPYTIFIYEEEGELGIMLEADSYEVLAKTEQLKDGAVFDAGIVCAFLKMLSCSNVRQEKIPAPVRLNKSRAKKGRPPIFEYHVLKVPGSPGTGVDRGGSHASPRFHFRRGHVRKLSEERLTWVRDCAVGDIKRGAVDKEYFNAASKEGER